MAKSRKPSGKTNRNRNQSNRNRNFQDDAMKQEYKKGQRSEMGRGNSPVPCGTSDNDPSWYIPTNVLANNVASFPYGLSTGLPLELQYKPTGTNTGVVYEKQTLPGILCYDVIPSVGDTDGPTAPINLAGSQQYTAMQILSSRNPLYNNADMIIFQIAVANLYALYSWMCRIYGTLKNYSVLNKYTPQALITAMRVDFDDIMKHQADFRAYINTFAYQLASFYLPKDVKYVARQVFLYENIYMDSSNSKAQYYMFNPLAFLKMVEGEVSNGAAVPTYLKLEGIPRSASSTAGSVSTYNDIITYAENLINPVRQSEDVRIMTADLIKAYGIGNTFTVNPIAETYTVTPVYNQEVLSQFENAYICPPMKSISGKITQNAELNNDAVQQQYEFEFSFGAFDFSDDWSTMGIMNILNSTIPSNMPINFHKDNPTPEDMLVASRLSRVPYGGYMVTKPTAGWTVKTTQVKDGGTEIIAGAWLYQYTDGTTLDVTSISTLHCSVHMMNADGWKAEAIRNQAYMRQMLDLMAFDWHPRVQYMVSDPTVNKYALLKQGYDFDNYTIITNEEWDRMNQIALLGLFQCALGDTPRMK